MNISAPRAGSARLAAIVLALAAVRVLSQVPTAPTPSSPAAAAHPEAGTAAVLEINGAIGPATSRYVVRGLEAAQKAGSRLVILQLDTPGGLDSAMRDIIRAILASPLPVVSYVSPSGRARRECRDLHSVRESHCRHGPGHQPRGGDAGRDRRRAGALAHTLAAAGSSRGQERRRRCGQDPRGRRGRRRAAQRPRRHHGAQSRQ